MIEVTHVETGAMGRVAYARIGPNEDLVQGVEKLCLAEGFRHAFVRGALGSLVDGCLGTIDGGFRQISGPAVEIVSLAGEVRTQSDGSLRAALTGVVADPEGTVFGGPFIAGSNMVCMTFEVTLEEWIPSIADQAAQQAAAQAARQRHFELPIPGDKKMNLNRRAVITSAAASVIALPTLKPRHALAQKAQYTLKYANNLPTSHPMNLRAKEMSAAIATETHGRVDLQVFPSSQLGSDTDTLSQVRSGGVDFFTLSGLILGTLVPAASITGVGFAFEDYDAVWRALDGELGLHVRQEIEKANLVVMEKIWDNGFRQVTSSSKPIQSAGDLSHFKIRVPVSPLWTSMFKALGASPSSINFSEVYTALQTKVVDGQENPMAIISTAKLNEVQKYCSLTNHMWDGFWFLANKKAWEKLPADVRAIVDRHINAAAMKERADVAQLNATLQKDLMAKGMLFNEAKPDSFRARLREAGFYAEWKSKFGDQAWAILERNTKKLA